VRFQFPGSSFQFLVAGGWWLVADFTFFILLCASASLRGDDFVEGSLFRRGEQECYSNSSKDAEPVEIS
jgi:hypothetical protein